MDYRGPTHRVSRGRERPGQREEGIFADGRNCEDAERALGSPGGIRL